MKKKKIVKILIAVLMVLAIQHLPAWGQTQTNSQHGSWGLFGSQGSNDNLNGGNGSWSYFGNNDADHNLNGGNGSWSSFNHEDPDDVPLADGAILLLVAGLCYGWMKTKNSGAAKHLKNDIKIS